MWVIPYHFIKLLHMTPSELNKIWCVGSSSGCTYSKGISPKLLVWIPKNAYLYLKRHNLDIFHCFENGLHHFKTERISFNLVYEFDDGDMSHVF